MWQRILFLALGTLGSVCLSLLALSADAQTAKASVTIAQGTTPPPFQPEAPPMDASAVRAIHQQMNDRYAQQVAAAAAAAEQRQQQRQQQFDETVQRSAVQAQADVEQASMPTRTPFQPESAPVAQVTPPPFQPEPAPVAQVTPPPFQPETPVSTAPEAPIEAPVSSATPTIVASAPQAPIASAPKSVPKSSPKATVKKLNLANLSFACVSKNGTPTTIAKLNEREMGVILWDSTLFADRGFDPQTRCNLVSQRFEEYSKANQLSYLTTGTINRHPVVCVTSQADGACGVGITSNAGLLFTLKPNSDGGKTLEQLSNVLTSNANTPTDPLKQ
ncbi:hypothetical protein IQ250_00635 [Pseudanabaenaceae cyanobacterium LEGE 13415]|nr:hypothetical protein [Pseudanabaenaceae cyanobacterium LEGE 13415]